MIGAAICKDGDGKIINLCSVSGISKRLEFTDSFFSETDSEFSKDNLIFVEPVVDSEKINSALAENDKEIHELTEKIKVLKEKRKISDKKYRTITAEEEQLSSKRSQLCSESLKAVYNLYDFHCADGKIRSLNAICGKKLPPTGTGDCSAPKLLNFAFKNNYQVLSLCEVYYGKSNSSKVSGEKYPPCDQRCSLILPSMLGLEILYRDS